MDVLAGVCMTEQHNCVCTKASHASKESVIHTDFFSSLSLSLSVMFPITPQLSLSSITKFQPLKIFIAWLITVCFMFAVTHIYLEYMLSFIFGLLVFSPIGFWILSRYKTLEMTGVSPTKACN